MNNDNSSKQFQIHRDKNFTVMSNIHIWDRTLSLKAKGLLSFMLSAPDDWDFSLNGLIAMCKEGRDFIQGTLNELKTYNYLKIEKTRKENGTFKYNYHIYENPFDLDYVLTNIFDIKSDEKDTENSQFKIHKNKNFTVMSNIHLWDRTLSLRAKGLLSFMLSVPNDWDFSLNGLIAMCKEGRDYVQGTLNELKEHYYLKIEQIRNNKGMFKYNYNVFENPLKLPVKQQNNPHTEKPYMDLPIMDIPSTVKPSTEELTQLNINNQYTNNKIDKIDKKKFKENQIPEIKHNILTNELIKRNYIAESDFSSFYFDSLFEDYLSQGHNYKKLYTMLDYIEKRVKARNYLDEEGNKIENRYGYFKNSLEDNLYRLSNLGKDLYSEELNDFYKNEGR